jgi:isopentenyldiphosphate isomerase
VIIKGVDLRNHATSDHKKTCPAHHTECTCGHDEETARVLRAAAKRIDELEATNRGYRERFAMNREDEQS